MLQENGNIMREDVMFHSELLGSNIGSLNLLKYPNSKSLSEGFGENITKKYETHHLKAPKVNSKLM